MGKIILITGGARSGKSSYALDRAETISVNKCFIATSPHTDDEMDDRIVKHQAERAGKGWALVEEELHIAQAIKKITAYEVVVIDCLTLWVNNLMYHAEKTSTHFNDLQLQEKCVELIAAAHDFSGSSIFVTNEVGMGIVPENSVARKYRDNVGRCNRYLAEAADEVILVACGIPLTLKK